MKEFVEKVKALWEMKHSLDLLKDQAAEVSKKLEIMKSDAMKIMETSDLDKFNIPGFGTIYRQREYSVRVPKDPTQKEMLFHWIAEQKGQEVLDNMVSINSQSLNSFYKSELEIAKEEGNVDFKIPGIETPEVYYKLGMRAK